MHTINLPYKQGYVTPVPAAVVVNTYEFREAEDPSVYKFSIDSTNISRFQTTKKICFNKTFGPILPCLPSLTPASESEYWRIYQ